MSSGRNRLNDFRLPFRSPPLPVGSEEPQPEAMVEFTMSNYTLASLLYWMDQYRKFDYEISKESINNTALVGYLRTECSSEDVCAGTLFPGTPLISWLSCLIFATSLIFLIFFLRFLRRTFVKIAYRNTGSTILEAFSDRFLKIS